MQELMFWFYFPVAAEKPRHHFVAAESYQVTWWPKDSNEEINSQATKGQELSFSRSN